MTTPTAPASNGGRDYATLPAWARSEIINLHAVAAAKHLGANPATLFGSTTFAVDAAQLDPGAPDFPARLTEAIRRGAAGNPQATDAPAAPVPPTSGVGLSPGSVPAGLITEGQLAKMTPEQVAQAYEAGQLKHLL